MKICFGEQYALVRILYGVDVGYHNSNMYPSNEGRMGKHGYDKEFSLDKILKIVYGEANIIVKDGGGKWYLKRLLKTDDESIHLANKKQRWRKNKTSRATMYVIDEWGATV